jgi:hypothetical protein
MKNKYNTCETNKRHTYIVQVAQDIPNTQLSLIIPKKLQYDNYWFNLQLGKSHATYLTSPRHSYIDSSHQDSSIAKTFSTPLMHHKCVPTIDSLSLLCHKTSHRPMVSSYSMPHSNLYQDFPNSKVTLPIFRLKPNKAAPMFST